MPSLHVIGEILGASGLSNERTLSLSHVVDLLSLHASSQHSFFCRWRLLLDDSDDDEAQVGWRSSSWELLQGDAHGQTQVHIPSASLSIPLTCNNGDAKSSHGRSELLELVWAHPIDLHLATTSAHVSGWPHLVFQVWSLDCFHQQQLCGTAKVCIPSTCGELLVDAPLVRTLPDSWLDRAADSLSLPCNPSDAIPAAKRPSSALTPVAAVHDEAQDPAESGTLDTQGTLLLRIAVLPFGNRTGASARFLHVKPQGLNVDLDACASTHPPAGPMAARFVAVYWLVGLLLRSKRVADEGHTLGSTTRRCADPAEPSTTQFAANSALDEYRDGRSVSCDELLLEGQTGNDSIKTRRAVTASSQEENAPPQGIKKIFPGALLEPLGMPTPACPRSCKAGGLRLNGATSCVVHPESGRIKLATMAMSWTLDGHNQPTRRYYHHDGFRQLLYVHLRCQQKGELTMSDVDGPRATEYLFLRSPNPQPPLCHSHFAIYPELPTMIASIWKRNHLLVALALAVLCAVLNTHSATAYNASAIESSEGHGVRGLAASAIEVTSAPTPGKTKKPKKTKTPKPTKAPKSATPAPKVTTKKPATTTPKATTKSPSTGATGAAASSGTALAVKKTSTGKCVTGDPSTSYISKAYVDWIWNNRMKSYVPGFKNYIFDQLMTNNGKLSYCVRWESTNKLTKATASKFKAMLDRQYAQWNKWLIGYGCWPFSKIEIEMVGIAVKDKSLIDWTDDSLGTIHVGDLDPDGVPRCPDACYKHRNFEASSDTSACKGKPFDISLWPTLGQGGGAGGDWGQRIDAASMLSTLDAGSSVIVAHEIGHGFGLPDFYQESEKPGPDMPKMIMEAGASQSVTEGDGWLIRRAWENVRMRYPSTSG